MRSLAMAGVALIGACRPDYQFHTVAVYEAARGRYSIRIEGEGMVRGGHDISESSSGVLTVSPSNASGPGSPSPFTVDLVLRENRVRFGNEWLAEGPERDQNALVVSRLLSQRGYSVHADELEELVSSCEGVLFGPKGTRMPGQTRVLKVISVDFDR